MASVSAQSHPFLRSPNRTLFVLSVPVLFSMIAEPLTGLVDTAFVAQLGAAPLAALGAGTVALSSIFWVFNFLQIGTQTEVAARLGAGDRARAAEITGLALVVSGLLGVILAILAIVFAPAMAVAMGAGGALQADTVAYIRWRAPGAPAVLVTLAAFGALRGGQRMTAPLLVALGVNLLNIVLNTLLIFGFGPIPGMGVAGAALASSLSQWAGAAWAVAAALRLTGVPPRVPMAETGRLLVVGGDLFVRTALLTGFILVTTRMATALGAEAGAAHQAIRQIWLFTALFLDAFAITGQSLVGFFLGAAQVATARRVAAMVCWWSLGVGIALGIAMIIGRAGMEMLLVPLEVRGMFGAAWIIAALVQPLNALAFATDGVHWGTGDYAYLRNAMLIATPLSLLVLWLLGSGAAWLTPALDALAGIWLATGFWTTVRAGLGLIRIWPGIGKAPLR